MSNENRVVNYKGYVISSETGVEKGIFLRSPLQSVSFDAYYDDSLLNAWDYLGKIKNPVRKLYEILIGNKSVVDNIENWSKDFNWAGFTGNILCRPIYFKRVYRKLKAVSTKSEPIQEITSYGYESEFNTCGGCCEVENTVIKLSNGKTMKIKRKEHFHFTYEHIIKKVIDTGDVGENNRV